MVYLFFSWTLGVGDPARAIHWKGTRGTHCSWSSGVRRLVTLSSGTLLWWRQSRGRKGLISWKKNPRIPDTPEKQLVLCAIDVHIRCTIIWLLGFLNRNSNLFACWRARTAWRAPFFIQWNLSNSIILWNWAWRCPQIWLHENLRNQR